MAALAPTNSATPSLQSSLNRSRVEAARREADQAESYAKTLRGQAQEQERVMVQARERVQVLEKGANQNSTSVKAPTTATTESSTSATTQPSPATVALEQKNTYSGLLADVFEAAKPILNADLSATQKNLVESSLLQAANQAWSANQTPSKVQATYGVQSSNPVTSSTGQMLNTLA